MGKRPPSNDPLLREPGFNVVTLTEQDTFVRRYRIPVKIIAEVTMKLPS